MDEAAFQAFLQGAQGGANPDDILGFQKNIMASNPYRMAAAPILGTRFDTSSWSPGTALAATAAQSFLGSVLQGLGQRREAQQMEAVAQALPSLYADPLKAQAPEGVPVDAFNALRGNIYSRQAKSKSEMREQLAKDLFGVELAGMTEEAKERGKNKAYEGGNFANPNSPFEKKATELKTDFYKREAVQNYDYLQSKARTLLGIINDPNGVDAVADPLIAKIAVQFVEPKLAVNAGEAAGLAQSTSIPDAWKGAIAQALEGKSSVLQPQVKRGLLKIAKEAFEAQAKSYGNVYSEFQEESNRFGIPIDRITKLGTPKLFADLLEENAKTIKAEGAVLGGEIDPSVLQAEATQLFAQGLSKEEVAAELRNKYKQ